MLSVLVLALALQEAPVSTAPPALAEPSAAAPPAAALPSPEPAQATAAAASPEPPASDAPPDAIDELLANPAPLALPPVPVTPPAPTVATAPATVIPGGAAPTSAPAAAEAAAALPAVPQPYVPSTPPTAVPSDPTRSVELSEDEAEGDPNAALPPQPYVSLPGSPLFEPRTAAAPRPYVAPRSLSYEIPAVAEQLYESGVRGNALAAQVGRGPLDGGWNVVGADGAAILRLQLSDDGSAVDGAWTDPNVPPGIRSGLITPAFRIPGSQVTLRFSERAGGDAVTLILTPGGGYRVWSGQLDRGGRRTAVTLRPF